MLFPYLLLTQNSYLLWLKVHSLGGTTVNNAAYSANFAYKFHSLEGATMYNDVLSRNYHNLMLFPYLLITQNSYLLCLKLHSLGGATVNNAAYSANFTYIFHSLEGAIIYNDA